MMEEPTLRQSTTTPNGETSMVPSVSNDGNTLRYSYLESDARTIIDHFIVNEDLASQNAPDVYVDADADTDDYADANAELDNVPTDPQIKGKGKEIESSYDESSTRHQNPRSKSPKERKSPRNSPRKGNDDLPNDAPDVPPKSPRPMSYTLPIGGGPKKSFVVSGGNRHQSMPSTKFVSASSSKSRMSAPSVPSIPEIHKTDSSPSKDRPISDPTMSDKSLTRSVSAQVNSKKMPPLPLTNDSPGLTLGRWPSVGPLRRRRTLSSSDTEDEKKGSVNSTGIGRSSRSTSVSDAGAAARLQTANLLGISNYTPKRRLTSSSVLMVEGQMFEINEGEEEQVIEKEKTPTGRRSVGSLQPLDENEAMEGEADKDVGVTSPLSVISDDEDLDDSLSLRDEPMVFTDDEIDDVPPPGAYAIHPPSKNRLAKAADLPLYDEDGNIVDFGTVFENRRTLICFLRHWLCPFCQMFSQSLQHIDPLPLETAKLDLVVVGQGHWHVTKSYKEVMKIPSWVRMYSDPSRKIYKALGMTLRTNDKGPACAKPDYQTMGIFKASMIAIKKGVVDMPLRPPGDLMLLGGEFILGPGLHCSFTHRMVTTRGHLDLPRILVQAGCDLSLKTPVDAHSSPRRPVSTKSLDRSNTRRLARKFGKGRKSSVGIASQSEAIVSRLAGDRTHTLRALSGDHLNYQGKTLSKSLGKKNKKHPPIPDIRSLKISHPIDQFAQTSDTNVDDLRNTPGYRYTYPEMDSLPPSPTNPIRVVKERMSTGMVNGFSKSQSMGDMNVAFTRPPRSNQRPRIPKTSSADAFAAASARSSEHGGSTPASPITHHFHPSPSMPNMTNGSSASVQTIQPKIRRKHHQHTESTSSTGESSYNRQNDPAFSIDSHSSSHSSNSIVRNDNNLDSPLTQSWNSQMTPSNSFKKSNKSGPISALEASRAATFSSSSPSLPLSPTYPDPSRSKQSSFRSASSDFGEDTEYKRLDKRAFEQPRSLLNGPSNDSDEERDVPLSVSEQDEEGRDWSPSKVGSNMPLLADHKEADQFTAEEEDDLQKTPLARKISLDFGENNSDDLRVGNRSSIVAGTGPSTIGRHPRSVSSSSTSMTSPRTGAFAQNALFAGLPSPPPLPQQYQNQTTLPSSRAPVSAPAPLFAAILAEEEARTLQNDQSNGNAVKTEKLHQKSPTKELNRTLPSNLAMGSSFLNDMDVHDGFVRQEPASDSVSNSASGNSLYESDEEEEEDDDDWAPLQASGNVIPARLSSEGEMSGDEDHSPTDSSDRSLYDDDDDSNYEDEEDEMNKDDAALHRAATASPSQEYELRKVTGRVIHRPLNAPVVSIPRRLKGNPSQQLYKQQSLNRIKMRRLTSFREEEEEEEEEENVDEEDMPRISGGEQLYT